MNTFLEKVLWLGVGVGFCSVNLQLHDHTKLRKQYKISVVNAGRKKSFETLPRSEVLPDEGSIPLFSHAK